MSVLSKRGPSTPLERSRSQEKILVAAVELLDGGAPFAEISVGAIAARAAVSRPTFYAYFRDKRDLILALGDRFERQAHLAADEWLTMRADDLAAALTGVLGAFRAQHSTLGAIIEAAGYDDEVATFWRTFHEGFIVAVAERARQTNPAREGEDIEADAFALVWMTERSFTEHVNAPRVSDRALIDALVRLWRSSF